MQKHRSAYTWQSAFRRQEPKYCGYTLKLLSVVVSFTRRGVRRTEPLSHATHHLALRRTCRGWSRERVVKAQPSLDSRRLLVRQSQLAFLW